MMAQGTGILPLRGCETVLEGIAAECRRKRILLLCGSLLKSL